MPENILAQCFDLSKVSFHSATLRDNSIEIHLSRDNSPITCPECGSPARTIWGVSQQRIRDLPISGRDVHLSFDKYRLECHRCGVRTENMDFVDSYSRLTLRFEEFVAQLCKISTLKAIADLLGLNWKTVKRIDKKYLEREFGQPEYEGLRRIAIDEIASRRGHNYFTIVLDLNRKKVIWVGKDRKKETLDAFFVELGEERCRNIEVVSLDMWDPYLSSIEEYIPQAAVVFDKFHIINSFSKVINKVRNQEYRKASETSREVIKGTKYLLLKNSENLTSRQRSHLKELLRINRRLEKVYILKDDLKHTWEYRYRAWAEMHLDRWIRAARRSRIGPLKQFAKMLNRHREGILSHCRYPIDNGVLEGFNNKIKVVKRMAYGFHDDAYFMLKIKQAVRGEKTPEWLQLVR